MAFDIQAITPAHVLRAYTGKPGCMCGCNGKYFYPSTLDRKLEQEDRGYAVDDEEINDTKLITILRTLQANEHLVKADNSTIFSAIVKRKSYVVYLREPAKEK